MKLEVGGTAHAELLNTDDDLNNDAPSVAPSEAPSDDPSDTPNEDSALSNGLSHAHTTAPSDAPGSISSDSSNESSSDSSTKAPISSVKPSDGIAFHMQVAEGEAEGAARGLRGVRERLRGWQCDMRAWAAAFVGAALLFVVLVVALSFALTDFTTMLPEQSMVDSRHAMEAPLPTPHPRGR